MNILDLTRCVVCGVHVHIPTGTVCAQCLSKTVVNVNAIAAKI